MIRRLTPADASLYHDHLHRVADNKGWFYSPPLPGDPVHWLEKDWVHIWARFDTNGNITQSLRSHINIKHVPEVLIVNYQSELLGLFNPARDMLPILDKVMSYFESIDVYNFSLVRKFGFFEWRKNKFFEDVPPLNRYNCYIDEVVPAGCASNYSAHRFFAFDEIYTADTSVVRMVLKQELRSYQGKKVFPDTKEMHKRLQNKQSFCIIGYNPASQKLGNALVANLVDQNVTTIGKDNFDFSIENWNDTLRTRLAELSTPLVIIINLFDHNRMSLQQEIFDLVWKEYKNNADVHIVVLGSFAHHLDEENFISKDYFNAKKMLSDTCFQRVTKTAFKCKLLLVEPAVIESYLIEHTPDWTVYYLTTDEAAKKIRELIEINSQFLSAAIAGSHLYTPNNGDSI